MPQEAETVHISEQIGRYTSVLKQRWYTITVITVVALLIGVGLSQLWPKSYESNTLFALRESKLIDDSTLERSLKQVKIAAKRQALIREIRSRQRIIAVLKQLEWKEYINAQIDNRQEFAFYAKVRDAISVEITPDAVGDSIVSFGFTWHDPFKARDFVNAMRDHWIEQKIGNYRDSSVRALERAQQVLEVRLKAYNEAQVELEKFDTDTEFASMGTMEENHRRRNELMSVINENRATEAILANAIRDIENDLAKIPEKIDLPNQKENLEYRKAELAYQKALDAYNLAAEKYTPAHHKLHKVKAKMEAAKAQLDALESEKYIVEGMDSVLNPRFNSKSEQLDKMKPEYEKAREALKINERELRQVEDNIARLPGIMAERSVILNHIEMTRIEYEKAHNEFLPLEDRVRSFEQVHQEAGTYTTDSSLRSQTFEIMEFGHAPVETKNPMGFIILAVAAFIGLGIGLGLTLAREMLKASFTTREEVLALLGRPVLGAVSKIMTESEIRSLKFRKVVYTSSTLLLILSLVAIIYICNNYPQLIPPVIVEKVNEFRESLG